MTAARTRIRRLFAVGILAFIAGTASVSAQGYFGRNKVQYRDFKFQILKTEHFDIYFYPEEQEAAQQAAKMAERWYARLARMLNHELRGSQPLILYASHPDFEQTNAIGGELGEGTGGVTESMKRRIVLPLGGTLWESDHVIGHELVHAFQYDLAGVGPRGSNPSGGGLARLPLWFIEGMAEYLSIGAVDPHTAMWMRDAAAKDKMPAIKDLEDPRYFPYRWGQALWAYITGRWGDHVLPEMLRLGLVTGDYEVAFQRALGMKSADLTKEWQAALRKTAASVRQQTRPVSDYGRVLQRGTSEVENLNVSPAISPDGRRMIFLSQRSLVSIDIYLADAESGKVSRKVTDTAVDPHFTSLGFIYSAGAWAPDSRRFAFSAVKDGRPVLVIYDADRGRVEQELRFPDLGEVFNPTWSPDGRFVAFSSLTGGVSDLFTVEISSGAVKRLTNDAFGDLQPAWSPDGRRIAFVTERFSTRLGDLDFGNYRLAIIELDSGTVKPVMAAAAGKNLNPQWVSNDELFFVSDRNGISNVYRAGVDGIGARQVTNLTTGISGITSISPAISYAPGARRLLFSVYEDDKHSIFGAQDETVLAGKDPVQLTGVNAALLPPAQRSPGILASLHANPVLGLPSARKSDVKPYRTKLTLDAVGQPYVGVGVDPYGTYAGGGISLFWSDMLGNHSLGTAVQVNSGFNRGLGDTLRNTGAQVYYQNLSSRWNWGVGGGQTPLLSGGMATGILTDADGTQVGVEEFTIYRQLERNVNVMTAYPFNRSHRLELSAGYANISFDQEVETTVFDLNTGQILSEDRQRSDLGQTLNLGQASAALVYDTSTFGATSPILGQRYRLQVTPTVGTLRMNTVLADYRHYVMPVSFYTLAARVLHYGRYGRDSQDPRLFPLFLGYSDFVRGYDLNSFNTSECTASAESSCVEFDRLLGSRMLVGNVELRFPLLRPFGVRPNMYGPIPLELAFFADAGVAWNQGQSPKLFGGDRQAVSSAGVALRANLFGFAIAQADFVKPFQRASKGWMFQFSLTPGF